jgi:predicted membrane chloride channel (bestrophin family)
MCPSARGHLRTHASYPEVGLLAFCRLLASTLASPMRAERPRSRRGRALSCRTFAANAVRLQLHALAYNLGNFLRTLARPEPIKDWSLTSLKDKLIKIGAKVVSHGRYVSSRWPRSPSHGKCSKRFCGSSLSYGRSHHQR